MPPIPLCNGPSSYAFGQGLGIRAEQIWKYLVVVCLGSLCTDFFLLLAIAVAKSMKCCRVSLTAPDLGTLVPALQRQLVRGVVMKKLPIEHSRLETTNFII